MLTSGDICTIDLGVPSGSEAGFSRPVVIVTSQIILTKKPAAVQVVSQQLFEGTKAKSLSNLTQTTCYKPYLLHNVNTYDQFQKCDCTTLEAQSTPFHYDRYVKYLSYF